MREFSVKRSIHAASVLIALGLAAGAVSPAAAGSTTIYKCFDRTLGVLFTDEPCSGEQLRIRAGDADPAAVAALQRERDALARSADQRILDYRPATLQRDFAPHVVYVPPSPGGYAGLPDYLPYGYAIGPYGTDRRFEGVDRHSIHRPHQQRVVPAPPGRLIRR